jgi:ComF family protein
MNALGIIAATKDFLLDLLFPVECLSCQRPGHFLCQSCQAVITLKKDQECPVCRKRTTPHSRACLECRSRTSLDGVLVAARYRDPIVRRAIHLYKYRFIEDLRVPLGDILLDQIRHAEIPLPDLLVPVPLHHRRLRFRGFNQSEQLADIVGRQLMPTLPLPVITGHLCRTRYTKPQMSISDAQERKGNLHGAFAWKPPKGSTVDIRGKHVWLIDDVATTGSTLEECAKILKAQGAAEVHAVVLAR